MCSHSTNIISRSTCMGRPRFTCQYMCFWFYAIDSFVNGGGKSFMFVEASLTAYLDMCNPSIPFHQMKNQLVHWRDVKTAMCAIQLLSMKYWIHKTHFTTDIDPAAASCCSDHGGTWRLLTFSAWFRDDSLRLSSGRQHRQLVHKWANISSSLFYS